jgi:hypothetical protein
MLHSIIYGIFSDITTRIQAAYSFSCNIQMYHKAKVTTVPTSTLSYTAATFKYILIGTETFLLLFSWYGGQTHRWLSARSKLWWQRERLQCHSTDSLLLFCPSGQQVVMLHLAVL